MEFHGILQIWEAKTAKRMNIAREL